MSEWRISDERRIEVRREFRRWCWRHPLTVAWRCALWVRYHRCPPWRLHASTIVVIDPRPAPPDVIAFLRRLEGLPDEPVSERVRT